MALALTIYSTLNLAVGTVLNYFKFELSADSLARANILREAILIIDGIYTLSNGNHLSVNELNFFIKSLAVDLIYLFTYFLYSTYNISV
jgi:hypothetical protein